MRRPSSSSTAHAAHAAVYSVAIVGNPNSGKSTLFNAITGGHQPVGNWAGVTVAREIGRLQHAGLELAIVDLPGVYSLTPTTGDEAVTRDHVVDADIDLLVNVVDASNLERNLYLTVQMLEMGLPVLVVLNMLDTAHEHGVDVDPEILAQQLGCPVVVTTASRRRGLDELRDAMCREVTSASVDTIGRRATVFGAELDSAIDELAEGLAQANLRRPGRWAATRALEGDEDVLDRVPVELRDRAAALRERIEAIADEDVDILMADARYERIAEIARAAVRHRDRLSATRSERIDRIALHPRLGVPVFLTVMYVMFMLTINVGAAFIDFFDAAGGALFVQLPMNVLTAMGLSDWIVAVVGGVGGGLQTVITFVPPVGIMFLCLRFLEDSGYMARAAFVTDRLMRALGLPGKAFVPMIVGFGCNVPAIMGARTLESERDRKLAVAMNPFMSCGARLPVYALFAAAFFPRTGQIVVFALYLIGIGFAVVTGLILKRTLLVGDLSPFIMELPPYHRPSMRAVLRGAWQRLRAFVVGAGRFIVPIVAILTLLGSMGTDGSFGNSNTDRSVLSATGRAITPIFAPMGIEQDNWPATVGIFTGVFAKEVVVGSLDSLYAQLGTRSGNTVQADDADIATPEEPGVAAAVIDAAAAVPGAVLASLRSAADPLGLSVGPVDSVTDAAAAQEVHAGTFGAMAARFDGSVGAFAYLLFILLYMPCVAATAAIYRETSLAWAAFVGAWTTGIAWATATSFYQLATLGDHPGQSIGWIAFVCVGGAVVVSLMRRGAGVGDARTLTEVASVAPPPVTVDVPRSSDVVPTTTKPPSVFAPVTMRTPVVARSTRSTGVASSQPPRPVTVRPSVPTAQLPTRASGAPISGRRAPFSTTYFSVSGRPDTQGRDAVQSLPHELSSHAEDRP